MKYLLIIFLSLLVLIVAVSASAQEPSSALPGKARVDSYRPIGYTYCDKKTGMCMLKANLGMMKTPTTFSDFDLCRYEPHDGKWYWMPFSTLVEKTITPVQKQVYSADTDPVVRLLTDVKGLLWLTWRENGRAVNSFIYSGMLCNDVMIGPARKGDLIATCIPGKDHAAAAYVPDPAIYCKRLQVR